VSLYCEGEKYDQAGRIQRWIASNDEETGSWDAAIDAYRKATKFFAAQKMEQHELSCLRRLAHLLGLQGQYKEASDIYSTVGHGELLGNLTKFNAPDTFLRSGLLLLATGPSCSDMLRQKLSDFCKADARFQDSRQCDFLFNLRLLLLNGTLDDFADHVYDYTSVCNLDSWCIGLLDKVYQFILSRDSERESSRDVQEYKPP